MYITYMISVAKWKFIKWIAAAVSIYLSWRLKSTHATRYLDVRIIDLLARQFIHKPIQEPFDVATKLEYEKTLSNARYWHGTGKWQYDQSGNDIDVLDQIFKNGGLLPALDLFDIKHGRMVSISLAQQRMYARIYADIHEYGGAKLYERYGSPRLWAYYFIMAINLFAIKELGLWNRKKRHEQKKAWKKQGVEVWAAKVNKNPGEATGKFFNSGSDIKDNYPILIGIKNGDFKKLASSDYVKFYESRVGSTIMISDFTHIEVPNAKLKETKNLLDRYGYKDLPLFSIEQCEKYYSEQKFSVLVSKYNANNKA